MMTRLSSLRSSLAPRSSAVRIALIYLLIGSLWILFSDRLVAALVADRALQSTLNTLKGWAYVLLTAGLLYWLIQRQTNVLHESEERLRLALMAANQGLYDLNVQTGEAQVNAEYATMLGYDPATFRETNARWIERLHPDDRAQTAAAYQAYVRGETPTYKVEFRQRTREGGWKWILSLGKIVERDAQGRPLRMLGTHTDITDHKRAEQALRDSEAKFRSYIEYTPLGVLVIDQTSHLFEINPAGARLLGYAADECKDLTFSHIIAPQAYEAGRKFYQALGRLGSVTGELALRHKDGTPRWALVSAVKLANNRFMAYLMDITDRKQAEEALKESEERFSTAFFTSPVAQSIINPADSEIVAVNDACCRLFEYSREELIGTSSAQLNLWANPGERLAAVEELQRTGHLLPRETSVRVKSGEIRTVIAAIEPISWKGVPCVITSTLDITARKQAEEKLQRGEQVLRLFVEHSPAAIAMFDRDMRYLVASQRYLADYGLGEQDLVGRSHYEVFPEITERWKQIHRRCLAGAVEKCDEDPFPRADGRLDWVRWEIRPWYEASGDIGGIILFSEVITARIEAEEALRESEARYRLLAENMDDVIWILDTTTARFKYVSPSVEKLRGFTVAEVLAQPMDQVLTPASLALINVGLPQRIQAFLAGDPAAISQTSEVEQPLKDGSTVWTEVVTTLMQNKTGGIDVLGVSRNITQRKQTEEVLISERNLLRTLIDHLPDYVYVKDAASRFLIANLAVARHMGAAAPDELVGKTDWDFYPPERAAQFQADEQVILQSGEPLIDHDEPNVDAAGQLHWIMTTKLPMRDSHGQIIGLVGIGHDLTERKRTEESLRASEARLNGIVGSAMDAIISIDADQNIVLFNAAAEQMFQWSAADVIGQPLERLLPARYHAAHRQHIRNFGETGVTTRTMGALMPLSAVRANGTEFPIEVSISQMDLNGQRLYTAILRDITQRQQAEAALREREELLSVMGRTALIGGWDLDVATGEGHWTEEVARIHDLDPATSPNKEMGLSFYTDESRVQISAAVQAAIEYATPYDLELEIISAAGTHKWIRTIGHPLVENGRIVKLRGSLQDITARKQAEDALRESEGKLRSLLELLPVGVSVLNAHRQVAYTNPALEKILQMTEEDLRAGAYQARQYIRPDRTPLPPAEFASVRAVAEQRAIHNVEMGIAKEDGSVIWINVSAAPTSFPDWNVVIVTSDITARKQAEEEILQLNATLEQRVKDRTAELSDLYNHAPCGYHSLDGDGVFVLVNDTELKWLGYEREEIIGKMKAPDLFTPASLEVFRMNFPLFQARGWLQDLELELVRKDGSILPILLTATAIYDQAGRFLMSRSTMIDHTDRKRAEAQRQAALEALQASQARLEAANQELEAFAYSISHDLRAPLRAIDGFSRIIMEDYAAHLDAEGRRLFGVVRNNTQKMDQLITDLLALSRVSRAQLATTHFDMTVLVHDVYKGIAAPEDLDSCNLRVEPLLEAAGDPMLLRQVWANLLSNALKYSRTKAERQIEVGSYVQDHEHVYYVKDNGVGFNPEYGHKLFGIFQRLHAATDFEGTGVGLAIVQRIVHRHGGRVWAESQPDSGATFYFSLPG